MMASKISIRVSDEVKNAMGEAKEINWNGLFRRVITKQLEVYKKERRIVKIE